MKISNTWIWLLSFCTKMFSVFCITETLIFSTSSSSLKEIDLHTGTVKKLADINATVESLAYDYKEKYMYVPRYLEKDILRFQYPGNQSIIFETVVVSTSVIIGVAFDSLSTHLYWTEVENGKIMRCNSDGSEIISIFNELKPSVLAIDIYNSYNWTSKSRITVDGKEHKVIINSASYVYGIEVDVMEKRLYWMERTRDLKSAWYNGSDVKTIISSTGNWNIAINRDFIFYVSSSTISKINKYSEETTAVVYSETGHVYALLIYEHTG